MTALRSSNDHLDLQYSRRRQHLPAACSAFIDKGFSPHVALYSRSWGFRLINLSEFQTTFLDVFLLNLVVAVFGQA